MDGRQRACLLRVHDSTPLLLLLLLLLIISVNAAARGSGSYGGAYGLHNLGGTNVTEVT